TLLELDTAKLYTTNDEGTTWYVKPANYPAMFGTPTLNSANNGSARWDRGSTSPLDQKSSTGWLAGLTGGVQTGDDYAREEIPVDELPVPAFISALWSYYMSAAEVYGVNLVIWIHDPTDFDKRVEVTQAPSGVTLEKGSGWNAHELDVTVTQFFYYGENVSGSDLTAGTQYTWAQFQADPLFKDWTIYRLTLEMGWYSTGTFDDVWVADIKLNGQLIRQGPASGTHRKTVSVQKTMIASTKGAGDVYSENATTGTDWDFDFGGIGYITKGVIMHDAQMSERFVLYLFSQPPTSETDDNVANTSPLTADALFFLGVIEFPAMSYVQTGDAISVATPSDLGHLPLLFDSPVVYGILVGQDGDTTVVEALTIILSADMEDN
ncbi:hypothetical protein LCGC14_2859230, partial [marine sediment metagenome]